MPTIYDNIERKLFEGLKKDLDKSYRADFCVGYLNLRGWGHLADDVAKFEGGEGKQCRLLVGMQQRPESEELAALYEADGSAGLDQKRVHAMKVRLAKQLRDQLTIGVPSDADERALRRFAQQIRERKVVVKLFLAYPLHAKLYLAFLKEQVIDLRGYVGSSNLTFAGLKNNGELNVDVVEQDAAKKLAAWFEERWEHMWCVDISEELITIIETSWAGDQLPPYDVFMKIVYHLSNEARIGLGSYAIPHVFADELLKFQAIAVRMAARMLDKRGGVLIGDVVGLGKTFTAAALVKLVEETEFRGSLIICPPNLVGMWKGFKKRYDLKAEVLSLGEVDPEKLEKQPRAKLVVLDESHNLRNAEGKRYKAVKEYIRVNESKVVLLSATPYNKSYFDLSAQLALFLDPEQDLGIRPERYIESIGGPHEFTAEHQCQPSTLKGFEQSRYTDDWKELMNQYTVRRTRSFIKKHSPIDEATGQPYIEFQNGDRFFFPERVAKTFTYGFKEKDPEDIYAKLYSEEVVAILEGLHLARYGLGKYTDPSTATEKEFALIDDLSRAGKRMIGYARTNLFKRLESSAWSFLLSVQRHIIRNHVFIHALENDLDVPIGVQDGDEMDTLLTDKDFEALAEFNTEEQHDERYAEHAKKLYTALNVSKNRKRFKWLRAGLFQPTLKEALAHDAQLLHTVWERGKKWDPAKDKQLNALERFCSVEHPKEKVLVFTQFADTAVYLHKELAKRKVKGLDMVTGNHGDPSEAAHRFSPVSNKRTDLAGTAQETRVLISTDVLSEGQNLQDAHIIINYDLPWALIRLIQRAGRIDRIGQKAPQVFCYSCLPEKGIEKIIKLRERLKQRITENAEVVGTDEVFFDGDPVNLHDLYAEKKGMMDEDNEDDVDLGSWAYHIWQEAVAADPALLARITTLPDVVLSTRALPAQEASSPNGVAVFVRTAQENEMLVWVNAQGEMITQSQQRILKALQCNAEEPTLERLTDHHALVRSGLEHVQKNEDAIGGQLGKKNGARYQIYNRMVQYHTAQQGTLFASQELKQAIDDIYKYPLMERAREALSRRIREHATTDDLAELVIALQESGHLVNKPDDETAPTHRQPHIICSMGLRTAQA
jgi:superfamily II DNA or RNA helicase